MARVLTFKAWQRLSKLCCFMSLQGEKIPPGLEQVISLGHEAFKATIEEEVFKYYIREYVEKGANHETR